ncbi:hypothetical protein [Photobacterium nomapromontoriensis]|uniref:hypothetical protein n=1 Tax=Photobacterium nomapromontoriensis TaxID=2910237 RepID=UPI003D14F98E
MPTHYRVTKIEARIQQLSPIGSKAINQLRSDLFVAALLVNELMIKLNAAEHHNTFKLLPQLINGKYQSHENTPDHETLWGVLFLLFPVMSTSLSSVESQFIRKGMTIYNSMDEIRTSTPVLLEEHLIKAVSIPSVATAETTSSDFNNVWKNMA